MFNREPYHKLPEYLEDPLAQLTVAAANVEFKTTRDMQIFRDWLTYRLEAAQSEQSARLAAESNRRHQRRRDQRKSTDQEAFLWMKENAEPGMIIKVTGARDGLGYREIIEVNVNAGTPFRSTVGCYQLDSDGNRKQIVEVMWNKFRGLVEFGEMPERPAGQGTPRRYAPRSNPRRPVTITPLKDLVKG